MIDEKEAHLIETLLLSLIGGGASSWLIILVKGLLDSYKIKRASDLAKRKVENDARIASKKMEDEAEIVFKKLHDEKDGRIFEWYNKIVLDQDTRMGMERKIFSKAVQRLEVKIAGLEGEVSKCRKDHNDCQETNSRLLIDINHLKSRATSNEDGIKQLENKINNNDKTS